MKHLALAVLLATTASSTASAQSRTTLPAQIPVENRRAAVLTELVINAEDGKTIARLAKPLEAGKRATLRLTRAKGCTVSVAARFDDEAESDGQVNLCTERVLRFVE